MPESRDVSLRAVFAGMSIIAAGIGFSLGLSWWLARSVPSDTAAPMERLAPPQELAVYLQEKHARLASYGPAEGEPGHFHIPIERAMQILARRNAR